MESATSLQGRRKTLPVDIGREAQWWGAVRFPPTHAYSTDPLSIASLANASAESSKEGISPQKCSAHPQQTNARCTEGYQRSRQLCYGFVGEGLPTALSGRWDFRVRKFLGPDKAAKNEVVNSCSGTHIGTRWRALVLGSVLLKLAATSAFLIDCTHEWAERERGVEWNFKYNFTALLISCKEAVKRLWRSWNCLFYDLNIVKTICLNRRWNQLEMWNTFIWARAAAFPFSSSISASKLGLLRQIPTTSEVKEMEKTNTSTRRSQKEHSMEPGKRERSNRKQHQEILGCGPVLEDSKPILKGKRLFWKKNPLFYFQVCRSICVALLFFFSFPPELFSSPFSCWLPGLVPELTPKLRHN